MESFSIDNEARILTINWSDGTTTKHEDLPEEPKCKKCEVDTRFNIDYIRFHGFCRPCFVNLKFGVPGQIGEKDSRYIWRGPVNQTSDTKRWDSCYGADKNSNNFGVGDIVFYDVKGIEDGIIPKSKEGTVLDIHEYILRGNYEDVKRFITKVFFEGEKQEKIVLAKSLEALTCNNINLDISKWEGKLDDVCFNFDPLLKGGGLGEVFENPAARAIYMGYRLNHIIDANGIRLLSQSAVSIAKELENSSLKKDRIHLWFKNEFNRLGFRNQIKMGDNQIAALIPYLTGEKVANYHIEEKASVV